MMFTVTDKIGDIVAKFPQAGEVFKAASIDFCCGGDRPLIEAIEEQGLGADQIVGELNAAYESAADKNAHDTDWTTAPLGDLIHHIVNTHHAYLQQVLPVLSELTTKILRVHGANHGDTLTTVHRLFHTLKMELDEHLIKEEQKVFPIILNYESNSDAKQLAEAIRLNNELNAEHDAAGDIIKELRKITDNFTVPADGCATYAMTFRKLEELEADLFQHIHLENNILFVRLEKLQAA